MIADLNQISETCGLREPSLTDNVKNAISSSHSLTTVSTSSLACAVIPSVTITSSSSTSSVPFSLQDNDVKGQLDTKYIQLLKSCYNFIHIVNFY